VKPRNIKELFLYRVNALASIYTRLTAIQNKRKFGLSMLDWRIIGLLAVFAPMSLNRVAQETNLDKGRASRAMAKLIMQGIVDRIPDESDGRGVKLMLTAKGKTLYQKLFPSAVQRNQELLAVLSAAERKMVETSLSKLANRAQEMLMKERTLEPGQTSRGSKRQLRR
jgi:DNA-binding MarR family transcriptional regulator